MKLGFIGLGFAGFPMAAIFAQKFSVTGIDIDTEKVRKINEGSYECSEEGISEIVKKMNLVASSDIKHLKDCDIVLLSLPSTHENFSAIEKTLESLDSFYTKDVVVLSTVYPGFTRKMQEKFKNITLSFVPVRTFEGKVAKQFYEFPHIIGAFNEGAFQRVSFLFESMGCRTVKAIPPEKAELAKLFSNTFRQAEFAISGELGEIAKLHGFDPKEIFYITNEGDPHRHIKKPGIWGGYCLPKDTKMLINHAKEMGHNPKLLEATEHVRMHLAEMRAKCIAEKHAGKALLFHGITSKPVEEKISDTRDSPVIDVIMLLKGKGCEIKIYDPNIPPAQLVEIAGKLGVKVASEDDYGRCAVIRHENYDLRF